MKRIIVLFITFWVLINTAAIGQINNTQLIKITPAQIQQMDLFQMEMMEIAEKAILESIKMEGLDNIILELNDQLDEIGVQNLEVEINFSITSNFNKSQSPLDDFRLTTHQNNTNTFQVVNSIGQNKQFTNVNKKINQPMTRSVVRVDNNFLWITLDNQNWHSDSNTVEPTTNFKIRNWKGEIQPGVSNYY